MTEIPAAPPPDLAKIRRELTVFFAGIALLMGMAILIGQTFGDDSRDPEPVERWAILRMFLGVNIGIFALSAALVALHRTWGAILGASTAVLDIVLFLASVAGRASDQRFLGPVVIWTLIALVIVRRTRLYLQVSGSTGTK